MEHKKCRQIVAKQTNTWPNEGSNWNALTVTAVSQKILIPWCVYISIYTLPQNRSYILSLIDFYYNWSKIVIGVTENFIESTQ